MSEGFLSYTTRDGQVTNNTLRIIREYLEDITSHVFLDLEDISSPHVEDEISDRIRNATVLYLCQSPAVKFSPWVRKELIEASQHGLLVAPFYWHARTGLRFLAPPVSGLATPTHNTFEVVSQQV